MSAAITCSDLTFAWPDGTEVLAGVSVAVGPGRTGLVGVNGSGKSTLLRLIAGELQPKGGAVSVTGEVGYLPQTITLETGLSVADLLGITAVRTAIHAIEQGDVSEAAFTAVGDDWDIEERALGWLDRLGLGRAGLDDTVQQLSGGEAILVALAALFLRRPEIILLDEPTNNLDLDSRRRLHDAVASWPGVMLMVSHDRELLAVADQIAELSGGDVRIYGGNLAAYEEQLAAEQDAARRAVTAAASAVRRQQRDLADAQVKQARRDRQGRKVAASGSLPRIVADARKKHAQESAGRSAELHRERLRSARDQLAEAEQAVRDDAEIRVDLPETAVPASRNVLTITGLSDPAWHPVTTGPWPARALSSLIIRGPERIALTGPNGAGKTTLLRAIAGLTSLPGLTVQRAAAIGYLPQRLDILDPSRTVLANVQAAAPDASVNEARAGLARFLFRGQRADQLAGSLSGGERFRAVLAALLLAQPPPHLLLLDEPTNNLDMASVRQLTGALSGYQGALLVASHDVPFLRSIGITTWLRLDRGSGLTATDPL
ncbi:MAG TPA: ABC-F family ATP-binding cassette domain-containing protein [Streptosporangiaceae bacterium]|nr:ABC-F family ATP-binding cassette domain-containing protein [Streptosporangiaceae bacterium]